MVPNGKNKRSESIFLRLTTTNITISQNQRSGEETIMTILMRLTFFTSDPRNDSIASLKSRNIWRWAYHYTKKKRKTIPTATIGEAIAKPPTGRLNKEIAFLVFASSLVR